MLNSIWPRQLKCPPLLNAPFVSNCTSNEFEAFVGGNYGKSVVWWEIFFHQVSKKKDREVSQPQVAFNYDVPTFTMVVNVITEN